VVGEVLESHATQVRTEIVCRVMDEIAAEPRLDEATPTNLDCPHSRRLNRSKTMRVRRIWHVPSPKSNWHFATRDLERVARRQRPLCDPCGALCGEGSHAKAWQGRGFTNGDALKDFALDETLLR